MNSTLLTLLGLSALSILVYFISIKFLKRNKEYVEKYPVKNPGDKKLGDNIETIELVVDPILTGTIKPAKEAKKETKKKTPKKKSSSLSGIGVDELPKVKKSSYKKSYNKKRKDTKKDKGDDLLLS